MVPFELSEVVPEVGCDEPLIQQLGLGGRVKGSRVLILEMCPKLLMRL
jgi:hypothetical protein